MIKKGNGGVLWITGFSSSGKTTVARILYRQMKSAGLSVIFLDGDDLRSIFDGQWGYERVDRVRLAKVYFRLASHLASQGYIVLISAIAMYDEVRQWVRQNISNALEAYLFVPYKIRFERDQSTKNIYLDPNIDSSESMYDIPRNPDIKIENFGENTPEKVATRILNHYLSREGVSEPDKGRSSHWNKFYSNSLAPTAPSSFARLTMEKLHECCKVLEVGCGNGRDSIHFHENGHIVTAIDSSREAIHECKKRIKSDEVQFINATIQIAFPFPGADFDVIYSRFTLHAMTLNEEITFIDYSRKLLKSGGRLFIECRSINDPLAREGEIISFNERNKGHYRRFIVKDELIERLSNAGFEVTSVVEGDGLAVFKDDNPVLIRVEARVP